MRLHGAVLGVGNEELERVERDVGTEPDVPALAAIERGYEVARQRGPHRTRRPVRAHDQIRPAELGHRRRLGAEPHIGPQ